MADEDDPQSTREHEDASAEESESSEASEDSLQMEGPEDEPVAVDFSVDDAPEDPQTFEHSIETGEHSSVDASVSPDSELESDEGSVTEVAAGEEDFEDDPADTSVDFMEEEEPIEDDPAETDVGFMEQGPETAEDAPAETSVDFMQEGEETAEDAPADTNVDFMEEEEEPLEEEPATTDADLDEETAGGESESSETSEPIEASESVESSEHVEKSEPSEPAEVDESSVTEERAPVDVAEEETEESGEEDLEEPSESKELVLQPELDAALTPSEPEPVDVEPLPEADNRGVPATVTVYRDGEERTSHSLEADQIAIGAFEEADDEETDSVDLSGLTDGSSILRRHVTVYRHNRDYTVYVTSDGETQWNDELLELGNRRPLEDGDVLILGGEVGLRFERP